MDFVGPTMGQREIRLPRGEDHAALASCLACGVDVAGALRQRGLSPDFRAKEALEAACAALAALPEPGNGPAERILF